MIACAEEFANHIALLRGLLDEALARFDAHGVTVAVLPKLRPLNSLRAIHGLDGPALFLSCCSGYVLVPNTLRSPGVDMSRAQGLRAN